MIPAEPQRKVPRADEPASIHTLEILDDDFSAYALPRQTPASQAPPREQPRSGPGQGPAEAAPAVRVSFAAVVTILTLIAAVAIGIYFWLQLKPVSGLVSLAAPAIGSAPPAPTAAPLPPLNASPGSTAAVAVRPNAFRPSVPDDKPLVAEARRQTPDVAEGQANASANDGEAVQPRPRSESSAATLVITRSKLRVNPVVAQAYDDYTAGRLADARRGYTQVLTAEAKNTDALHGMAAISLREARHDAAAEYFLRALEANPKDAIAQAGLIGLNAQLDPARAESRLKSLLAQEPGLSFLHFALGNLYAREQRWPEAEQAYFKAATAEPDNPDALFNLAVSLDRLRQPKLALQYYQQAKTAAARRTAAFDAAALDLRLSELQQ